MAERLVRLYYGAGEGAGTSRLLVDGYKDKVEARPHLSKGLQATDTALRHIDRIAFRESARIGTQTIARRWGTA